MHEQLRRLAGLDVDVVVEPLPGTPERTRAALAHPCRARRRRAGRAGLRAHRSHDVVPLDDCLIADERVIASGALSTVWTGCTGVDVVAADEPQAAVEVPLPVSGPVPAVGQHVVVDGPGGPWEESFVVSARGFWQVHPAAAPTFLDDVLSALDPQPGERALDLYAGVGLFAAALADAVGHRGSARDRGRRHRRRGRAANLEDRRRSRSAAATSRASSVPSPTRAAPPTSSSSTRRGPGPAATSSTRSCGSPPGGSPTSPATPRPWPATRRT